MKSKNSIKKQLTITFAVAAGVIVLLAFSVVGMLVQSNITKLKTDAAYRLIDDASESISTQIDTMFATAYTIASDVTVCNPALTFEQKLPTLQKYAADRKINSIGYITGEGYLTSTDGFENDISTRQYFIDMMAGGKYISNPSFNTATQSQIIFIGVPLYYDNKIVAAMTLTFDSSYMSNIISNITYDGLGEAYMLSTTGTYIASNNIDDVLDKKNNIDAAAEDASLQPIADLEQKMISTPEGEETFNGTTYFYNKIANSDGWTLIFKIPSAAFSKEMITIWTIFVVCEVCVLALIIALSIVIGSNLGNRLLKLESYISKVSDGDFSVKLDSNELNKADEIGMIYKALDKTISDVGNAISSIKAYTVELSSQADSLESTSDTLNNGTSTVVRAMNEIQTGNSEQAREIENINNEMANFNENVKTVNDSVEEVVGITNTAAHQLTDGNKEMALLKESFNKFNDFFASFAVEINAMNDNLSSVSMITSTISDIAEETNLLSLNASIEAARAGEAGRGFAVVAQEIAKLAQQSADSVGEISNVVSTITTSSKNLIETSAVMGDQIKSQDTIIDSTLTSFEDLTQKMKDMLPAIENISKISKDNLMMARNIGDSISNANSISEELVATTSEVSATSRRFSESSDNVNVASNSINDLSANLNQLANKFTC